jgi:TatD family-associated radical SAM protein
MQQKILNTIAYESHGNLYLNITNRCNLRCNFCPKYNRNWIINDQSLILKKEPDVSEIIAAIKNPASYQQVVFCGLGEPTLRLQTLLAVADYLKSKNSFVRLNTNGLGNREYKKDITSELSKYIDAISISLNSQNERVYNNHCRPFEMGSYYEMRDFITCATDAFSDVTITAIDDLDEVNISECEKIANKYGVKFKRRMFNVVG